MPVQAHIVGYIIKFLVAHLFQPFPPTSDFLVNLHGSLGHYFVSFLCAPHQRKVPSLGDSFMAVRVKTDSEHHGLGIVLILWLTRHYEILPNSQPVNKSKLPDRQGLPVMLGPKAQNKRHGYLRPLLRRGEICC